MAIRLLARCRRQLGLLTSLTALALSSNFFSGTLPSEIYRLSQLTWLSLSSQFAFGLCFDSHWQFAQRQHVLRCLQLGSMAPFRESSRCSPTSPSSGSLATSFAERFRRKSACGRASTGFYVESNDLSGTIPTEISRLTALSSIFLTTNRFVGPLPELKSITKPENASSFHCYAQYPNTTETNCFSVCANPLCVCGTKRCPYNLPATTLVPPTDTLQRFPTPAPAVPTGAPSPTSRGSNNNTGVSTSDVAEDVPIIPIVLGVGGGAICLAILVVVWCIVRRERRNKAARGGGGGEISVSNSLATMPAGQQSAMHSAMHDPNLSTQFSHTPSSLPSAASDAYSFNLNNGSSGVGGGGGMAFNGSGVNAFDGSDRAVTTYQNSAMFLPSPMKVAVATSYRPIHMSDQRSIVSSQQYGELSLQRGPVSPYYQINDDM
jgi:hypothetical protein